MCVWGGGIVGKHYLVLPSCKEVLSIALNHVFLLVKDDNTKML